MSQLILGIDVGSYSIKVAEIERTLKEFHLIGFFEQPIANVESLGREVAVTQALSRLFEEYNLSPHMVYTGLPGQVSSHRVIDLPFADFKKVDQTIEFEMENYVPLPLEELLIDYEFLSSSKTGSSVLVSYVKAGDFVKFLNALTAADVDPRFVGSEPVEMANVMKLGVLQPEGAYAVIDVGHEKTNVLIFVGPKLQFTRTIMVGGRDLTRAIAESLNIPVAEAERMKIEMGQIGPDVDGADQTTRNVATAMQAPLDEILLHLKQTFMAFQEEKKEVVQALVLCGGTSRLPGIDQYFSGKLRKNVSFLDCLDFPFNQLADSAWCRPIAASALGLAYRGVIGAGIRDIQFRRGEFAYKGEVKEYVGFIKQAGILLGIVLVCAVGSFVVSYSTLKGRVKNATAQVSTLASQALPDLSKKSLGNPTAILSTLTGKINDAQEKKKKIEDETALSVMDALREFSAALPPRNALQLDVNDFTFASHKIRMQGQTVSFEAVEQIKAALATSKMFKNVATENVRKTPKGDVVFSVSMDVTAGAEEGGG
ncbi:MAG TPA: pilus assembly protein PilM [bacterium]|nr:pilus assembly protein PilM [bacterium]